LKPGNLQPAPAIGSTVMLAGLVSRSDLNGRRGIVHGFKCETRRFEVKVDGEAILSLKPQNLREVVSSSSGARGGWTADQHRVVIKVRQLATAKNWLALSAMAGDALRTARELRQVQPQWAGGIYGLLGSCYCSLGQYAKAMELYEQALAIEEEMGDRALQGATLGSLGNCYRSLGQYAKAIQRYEHCFAIQKELGDRAGQVKAMHGLGNCYSALDQHAKAMGLFEQALAIEKELELELGDRDMQGMQGKTLHGLGNCYLKLGQYAKAMERYKQALDIAEEVDDREVQGIALSSLGRAHALFWQEKYRKICAHAPLVPQDEDEDEDKNELEAALRMSMGICQGKSDDTSPVLGPGGGMAESLLAESHKVPCHRDPFPFPPISLCLVSW
jgi:tetratricopeptide (TPR) repeat protein